METAIARSINLPAIYTAKKVGVKNVIKYARLMGIHSPLEPYLPIAIGGIPGVHPMEMASAYCTFANDGAHAEPIAITRIANSRGETQEDFTSEAQQVISKQINDMMDGMFRGVVTRGTGRGAQAVSEARGKTGTTNDDRDVWFIGYVPKKIVAAVWVGNDNNSSMRGATGGGLCIPIWRQFMLKSIPVFDKMRAKVKENDPQQPKPEADKTTTDQSPYAPQADVTANDGTEMVKARVCTQSGLLATSMCPHWRTKRFAKGSEPTAYCNVHGGADVTVPTDNTTHATVSPDTEYVTVTVCSESGMLAGHNCPRAKKRFPVDEVPTQVCNLKHDQARE